MNSHLKTPRCPYIKVGGLFFLGRTIDKIRLKEANLLNPDFFELMGAGFDGRMMDYLGLRYVDFAEFVLSGASDDQCWDFCVKNGRTINDLAVVVWNDYSSKRGWRDSGAETLAKFKSDANLSHRNDIQTFFDFWAVDEGREITRI